MKTKTRFCRLQRFLSVLSVLCILLALIPIYLHLNVFAAEDTGVLIADAGQPTAMIIVLDGASAMEKLAAEELQYHIEKVSGAILPINEGVDDGGSSFAGVQTTIIIATPDSYPELNVLFSEDIAWLKDTGRPGNAARYGDDGFAVRQIGDTIYIFGANARGTLNGVYDFIEENMGVLWIRANEDIGLVYDEMPTITASKVNYAEKSPFQVRGWHLCSIGANGEGHSDPATEVMMSRNKLNAKLAEPANSYLWEWQTSIGISPFHLTHNISSWILESPIYDPAYLGYWNTDDSGNRLDPSMDSWESIHPRHQINYWDQGEDGKTLQTVIASVLHWLENNPSAKYVGIGINDTGDFAQIPEQNDDFEYAPGQFVSCEAYNYKSTVTFSFINKVAKAVAEVYPDVTVNAYAYSFAQIPPECDIEENICIVFAPGSEDVTDMLDTTDDSPNQRDFAQLQDWEMKCNNIVTYNYYGCFTPSASFERPIADKIQGDMQYFAGHGFTGLVPEGVADSPCSDADSWAMNQLTFWLYGKMAWDPYADVEALIAEFCEKVYGDAGKFMLEYYYYLRQAWVNGREGVDLQWNTGLQTYLDSFLLDCGKLEEMAAALNNAWNAANDVEKERICYIRETFLGLVSDMISVDEVGFAVKTNAGKNAVLSTAELDDPFADDIWADAIVLERFLNASTLAPTPGASMKVRLLWDEDYLYIGYENYHNDIANMPKAEFLDAEAWWDGVSEDVETFLMADLEGTMYAYFTNPLREHFRYYLNATGLYYDPSVVDWDVKTQIIDAEDAANDRWIAVQAISFESLGIAGDVTTDTNLYGTFFRDVNGTGVDTMGWNGAFVWDTSYLGQIKLIENEDSEEHDHSSNNNNSNGDATEPAEAAKPGSSDAKPDDTVHLKIIGVILVIFALAVGTILGLKTRRG